MVQQTEIQNSNAIRFGSGKVEVGDDVSSLVNLGAMQGVTFEESWDEVQVESDNAGTINLGKTNQTATISGDLMEVDLENLAEIRGGIDNLETVDGTQVTGTTQTESSGEWSFGTFIPIENQNADGSMPNVTDVSGGTDGSYSEGDDYEVVEDETGEWGIIVLDSGTNTTDTNQELTITYDYTPAEAKILKSGGKTEVTPKVVRITNVDENGNEFRITLYNAKNQSGISLELQADESGDFTTTPLELQGRKDADRTVGEQLYEIYDEQGVA